jgi:hypothetical protein
LSDNEPAHKTEGPTYIKVEDKRPEGYDGTCLRPLGLCDLGGCCESCWYRPDHPRFQKRKDGGSSD